ncbi:hypothetical protein [Noviherbaspirillum suwonense]|uniref:Single-stranded DNA-binding protein n=1 Tax=Noviherbaspirillum suwonense TaxID=1224511 RepID=A0ABY1QWX8_9BURK|nr:hypothetical protein [Noviherbaspirillum suwonense]SMP81531.1 hypothetical protein SAMN06295970_1453 [Noviherbaspirillum suwonense]
MAIALILKNATGSLFPVTNPAQGKPVLEGFVEFSLDDKKDGKKLRLEASAWLKDKDGKKFYSLSIGGISAALFKEKESTNDKLPAYAGTFGFERELRLAAWKKTSNGSGKPYLSLAISEKTNNGNTTTNAPSAGATSQSAPQTQEHSPTRTGVEAPDFDFV